MHSKTRSFQDPGLQESIRKLLLNGSWEQRACPKLNFGKKWGKLKFDLWNAISSLNVQICLAHQKFECIVFALPPFVNHGIEICSGIADWNLTLRFIGLTSVSTGNLESLYWNWKKITKLFARELAFWGLNFCRKRGQPMWSFANFTVSGVKCGFRTDKGQVQAMVSRNLERNNWFDE